MATEAQILATRNPQLATRNPQLPTRTIYPINQFESIMQNKPNFRKTKMNLNSYLTKDYENKSNWKLGENKANTNPIPEKPK